MIIQKRLEKQNKTQNKTKMVLKRTPKNTQTATHEPQGPQHLPEENHPRRWIFIFRNMITPIDVSEQLHAELLMSENPQGNQILLEEEANRRLNRKGQDAFSIIGSKNAPLQGGAGGKTSTPDHGGVRPPTRRRKRQSHEENVQQAGHEQTNSCWDC